MYDFLEKLRARPEGERRAIVIGTAFVITAPIFLVWLSVITLEGPAGRSISEDTDAGNLIAAPIAEVGDRFRTFFESSQEDGQGLEPIPGRAISEEIDAREEAPNRVEGSGLGVASSSPRERVE